MKTCDWIVNVETLDFISYFHFNSNNIQEIPREILFSILLMLFSFSIQYKQRTILINQIIQIEMVPIETKV